MTYENWKITVWLEENREDDSKLLSIPEKNNRISLLDITAIAHN